MLSWISWSFGETATGVIAIGGAIKGLGAAPNQFDFDAAFDVAAFLVTGALFAFEVAFACTCAGGGMSLAFAGACVSLAVGGAFAGGGGGSIALAGGGGGSMALAGGGGALLGEAFSFFKITHLLSGSFFAGVNAASSRLQRESMYPNPEC